MYTKDACGKKKNDCLMEEKSRWNQNAAFIKKNSIWTFVCAVAAGSNKLLDISVIYAEYSVF